MRIHDRMGIGRARGAIAIIVALALVVLVAFVGIGVDIGRVFVYKTKLQTAADACALAAANELVCDPSAGACPLSYLQNAQAAGIKIAGLNAMDATDSGGSSAVQVAPGDVRFSTTLGPNSDYRSASDGAVRTDSRYAMCIARAGGIHAWLMKTLTTVGIPVPDQSVAAMAVAVTAPSQSFCDSVPIGVCGPAGSLKVGQWLASNFNNQDDLAGGFVWVDFTPTAGGSNELNDQLVGIAKSCHWKVGDTIPSPGAHHGAKSGYNTRFGLYDNQYTMQSAPPDLTGYAYPNQAPGSPVIPLSAPPYTPPAQQSAYSDYKKRQGTNDRFDSTQYNDAVAGGKVKPSLTNATSAQLKTYGSNRRLVAAPVIDCNTRKIQATACVLMLNPMSNGNNGTVFLEYRGPASDISSPCRGSGVPGAGGAGPNVPTLVQ